jgi:hypothetical protein
MRVFLAGLVAGLPWWCARQQAAGGRVETLHMGEANGTTTRLALGCAHESPTTVDQRRADLRAVAPIFTAHFENTAPAPASEALTFDPPYPPILTAFSGTTAPASARGTAT